MKKELKELKEFKELKDVKMKKGQAAMEFLMTYGWAILIVLVAIGSIAYFGVLSPESFLPEKCVLSTGSGLFCEQFSVSPGEVRLKIRNTLPEQIEVTAASITQEGDSCTLYAPPVPIQSDGVGELILNQGDTCLNLTSLGKKLKGEISITYTRKSFPKTTTGSLVSKVAEVIGGGPSCTDHPDCSSVGSSCDGDMPYTCSLVGGCLDRANGTICGAEEECQGGICIAADYVAYWKFDEQIDMGTYNMTPDENGVNNGTIVGNLQYVSGQQGQALEFDGQNGANDYVVVGTGNDFGDICSDGCTFSIWAIQNDSVTDGELIGKFDGTSSQRWIRFEVTSGDTVFIINNDGTSAVGASCSVSYTAGDIVADKWYHYVGVYDNSTGTGNISLYRDGDYLQSTVCSWSGIDTALWLASNENTMIGMYDDDGFLREWNGTIDEVMIYNRALNSTEIQDIYNAQSGTCTNDPGCSAEGSFCVGDVLYICSLGGDGCLDIDSGTDCTLTGEICSGGVCVPNICDGIDFCSNYTDSVNCSADDCGVGGGLGCNWTGSNCEQRVWQPILGIPEPPFGITESHWMYELGAGEDCISNPEKCYDFGNGLEPYKDAGNGPYTHYLDNTHPNATPIDNLYGTPDKPRVGFPPTLAAGSVVEIHNGPYTGMPFPSDGTLAKPIFLRGVNGEEPVVRGAWYINGDYYIIENIDFDQNRATTSKFIFYGWNNGASGARTHLAIRNNEFHNTELVASQGNVLIYLEHEHNDSNQIKNVVVYNNWFHNCGEDRSARYDVVGVGVNQNVEDVWVVDNLFHHMGGDGVQIATSRPDENAIIPNHVYIGRNMFHNMYENAVDLKKAQDVIISQNTAHDFGPAYSEVGGGGVFRYAQDPSGSGTDGRARVWTIFNRVYRIDAIDGIMRSANTVTHEEDWADEIYFIGNIISDSHNANGTSTVFWSANQQRIYFIDNVVYDVDLPGKFRGAQAGSAGFNETLTLINNIFGTGSAGYHLIMEGPEAYLNNMSMSNDLFFEEGGSAMIRRGVYDGGYFYTDYTIDEFIAAFPSQSQGFIEDDPLHVDADGGDFRLQSNSPARDNGTDAQIYYDRFYQRYGIDISVDFEGNPRPSGTGWDIGPYEYVP